MSRDHNKNTKPTSHESESSSNKGVSPSEAGYNNTILLPKTDFPMRAGLPKREPEILQELTNKKVYEKLMEKNAGKPAFILHDGPPFSNGDIHLGHALNKILKDIIVKHKNMSGFLAPYTPGWDNHGMPIEKAIIEKNKLDRKKMSIPEFRNACHAFALEYVNRQREQFKRLGVIGDWGNPYLTMDPAFEAEEVRVFGKMYEKGYIYKGFKPVYWCPTDETALAEAEIEYKDVPCEAIYVKFAVVDSKGVLDGLQNADKANFLIWTTTPWTLPGNLAITLGPDIEYAVCSVGSELYILAAALVETVFQKLGVAKYKILKKLPGSAFELVTTKHPLYDRESLIIVGDHVTVDAGTGAVHTAPGHGVDDYNVCRKYSELPMLMPVDARGIMTQEADQYAGMHYSKANAAIVKDLEDCGNLLFSEKFEHSYPHCWRCRNPVIFRATEQWFASVDAMKEAAVAACENITWMPAWGKERMIAMLIERNDWCISRQRHWGLPIPVFYCKKCEEPVCTPETINYISALFKEKGSNAWYELEVESLLPADFECPHCGFDEFEKGLDSLDCWFDSGSTHAAVLHGQFPGLRFPADIYLEGGDQYRGWFQSSMLTSIATTGVAPYKIIITNGWTLDGEGKAMHKSLGNAISPEEIVGTYGADILRLWVSSIDYKSDVRMSKDMLKQLSDIYLKIRNTARFILGNIHDFDINNPVSLNDMPDLDLWALARVNKLVATVCAAYEKYEYHTVYHAIHNFCTIDMSSFYLDIIKDRLYCDPADSLSRKSAQTVISIILNTIVRMLAPVLAFTSEEIWAKMPHLDDSEKDSVLFSAMPTIDNDYALSPEKESMWNKLLSLRADVYKALEIARADKIIGKSLEAEIILSFNDSAANEFKEISHLDLSTLFIVSSVTIKHENSSIGAGDTTIEGVSFPGVLISVKSSTDSKCARCWIHNKDIGKSSEHPELCPRCVLVVSNL